MFYTRSQKANHKRTILSTKDTHLSLNYTNLEPRHQKSNQAPINPSKFSVLVTRTSAPIHFCFPQITNTNNPQTMQVNALAPYFKAPTPPQDPPLYQNYRFVLVATHSVRSLCQHFIRLEHVPHKYNSFCTVCCNTISQLTNSREASGRHFNFELFKATQSVIRTSWKKLHQ
jgi:hypothetical protein